MTRTTPPAERFWPKVDMSGDCWPWMGATDRAGYGLFELGVRQLRKAHRMAWELTFGPLPLDTRAGAKGTLVLHRCDNPPCVRPTHLFLGTHSDNMLDAAQKGRHVETRKTHCPQGHEYTPENTYRSNGGRHCRQCSRDRAKAHRHQTRPPNRTFETGQK